MASSLSRLTIVTALQGTALTEAALTAGRGAANVRYVFMFLALQRRVRSGSRMSSIFRPRCRHFRLGKINGLDRLRTTFDDI